LGVLKLAGVLALIAHTAGRIDEQMCLEVRLFLVLFDIIAIRFAVGAPIDVANFVAGIILAMLGELDGEALVRTLMHAGEKALDEVARHQGQMAVLGQRRGIERDSRIRHQHHP
jgi:hypothetical protein